ncbi:MAG: BON domain-containing protein, partial [Thermoguttaceae bacterium]|nr:BON domain-containing protein [Thermoguttaceae bacterium]
MFVPVFFGLVIALGVSSVQAGNQEEANKIAQRLTQQYPQYNIEVAYQEGKVRLRGEVGSEAEKAEIANFVRRIPKVRSVSETMTVSAGAAYVEAAPAIQYAEPATGIRSVQALTPAAPAAAPALPATPVAPVATPVEYEYAGAPIGVPAEATVVGAPGAVRSPSDFFAPQ